MNILKSVQKAAKFTIDAYVGRYTVQRAVVRDMDGCFWGIATHSNQVITLNSQNVIRQMSEIQFADMFNLMNANKNALYIAYLSKKEGKHYLVPEKVFNRAHANRGKKLTVSGTYLTRYFLDWCFEDANAFQEVLRTIEWDVKKLQR